MRKTATKQRELALLLFRSQIPKDWNKDGRFHAHCDFFYGTKRKADGANSKTMMKHHFDALTILGAWADDNRFILVSESQSYHDSPKKKEDYIIITITRLDQGQSFFPTFQ